MLKQHAVVANLLVFSENNSVQLTIYMIEYTNGSVAQWIRATAFILYVKVRNV
jgi:hypothetical protein